MRGERFSVQRFTGSGVGVQGSGLEFGVQGSGLEVGVQGSGFRGTEVHGFKTFDA